MNQLPSTPTSLAPLSPTPLNTSFFLQQQQQQQLQDGLVSPILKEDISTIFVVGFPEDMQEREFQNMFMFSPGFEAATLKVPNGGKETNEEDYLMNNNAGRKQIIGFAKFRTRKEAIDARDVLNGRKVDAEKGNMLKAEMAKKNLHTKRGLLNEQQQSQAQQQQQAQISQILSPTSSTTNNNRATYEAFYSVPHTAPNEILSPTNSDFYSDMMDDSFISRSQSVDIRSSTPMMDSSLFVQPSMSTNRMTGTNRFYNNMSTMNDMDYLSKSTPITETYQTMNSFLLQQSIASPHHNTNNNNNKNIISPTTSTGLNSINRALSPTTSSSLPPPPGILSPTSSYRSLGGLLVGSSNPADQNPPCNTLYVGNLPPNTNEEELKQMFCKCPGYKRLSFRNKSNGPMCFVEFDDAIYAAQALQDLHGNPLSNSIKGGIRLSFSKNPLGVRQNNASSNNNYPPMVFNNRRGSVTTSNFDPQLS